MNLPLSARIAWRYLRAKKSHSAVGAITAVSVCGIAVATAAIICVLSVFNGFRSLIAERIDSLTPDVIVTPAKGKVFANGDSLAEVIRNVPGVEIATPTILDNALAVCNGRETPVSIKGVTKNEYSKITALNSMIIDSIALPAAPSVDSDAEDIFEDDRDRATLIAVGTSARLNAFPGNSLLLFAPRREGKVNLANPAASFLRDSLIVTGVYQSNQADYDENRIVVDIDIARDIFLYDEEASAVEVKGRDGITSTELAEKIAASLSGGETNGAYVVKDRLRQQEMNFRMISIEKWVTFLLLFFILVIASFNIISSLSMLVIDKERSISTLNSLGMSKGKIASIFRWESIFVSLTGGAAGLAIGLLLCWLQQNFGFIKLQGDPSQLVVQSYPVMIDPLDILITFIPLILIAFVTALITGNFAKSRIG